MAIFLFGNTLLQVDLEKAKTYQNIWGQQVVRPFIFYLKKFKQIGN